VAIEGYGLPVRGNDVPLLVDYVEEALNPVPATYRFLGLGVHDVEDLLAGQDLLIERLIQIGRQARDILGSIPAPIGQFASIEAVEERPWLRRIHPLVAAMSVLGDEHRQVRPRIADIRVALSTLEPRPRKRGNVYKPGLGAGLVRAVCLYRHVQKLSLSFDWDDRQQRATARGGARGGAHPKKEWPPTTQTNELILIVAREFRVPVDTSGLRTELLNYRKEMTAEGRALPEERDLYGSAFDDELK